MNKWEQLQLTLDNLKSEGGQSDYQDKTKTVQDNEISSYEI